MAGEKTNRLGLLLKVGVAALVLGVVTLVMSPSLRSHAISRNETAAVAALRTYLGAQSTFGRTDFYDPPRCTEDRYATLAELGRVGLIDKAMAEATTPKRARAGYYFVEIKTEGFDIPGLCAVPAKYGKTGRNTFVIDITGVTYQKDTGGEPVRAWSDVFDGWIPVGAE